MEKDEMWLKKIKERLENHAEPVPEDGWQRLAAAVETGCSRSRARLVVLRRRVTAIAAACLAVVGIGTLMLLYGPDSRQVAPGDELSGIQMAKGLGNDRDDGMSGQTATETAGRRAQAGTVQSESADMKSRLMAEAGHHRVSQEYGIKQQPAEVPPLREEGEEGLSVSRGDSVQVQDEVQAGYKKEGNDSHVPDVAYSDRRERETFRSEIRHESGKQKRGWALALSGHVTGAGDAPSSRLRQADISGSRSLSSVYAISTRALPDGDMPVVQEELSYLMDSGREVASIKHNQPVSVGLSVRKNLSHGLSLETGLFYTYLSSDVTFLGSDEVFDQKLHYLGIPLRLNWDFFRRGAFVMYASAGGAMEKCVYGQFDGHKETVSPLQWSLLGAVGAQIDMTRHMGFYVEPGVSYYFDDGSAVQTIRKENPCSFTFQAGFRFSY